MTKGHKRQLLAALAGLTASTLAACRPGSTCDEQVVAGEYRLCVHVLHPGTRSEGRIGRLFRLGEEVPASTVGQTVDVPLTDGIVRFTWKGHARPHLWSHSGWIVNRLPP